MAYHFRIPAIISVFLISSLVPFGAGAEDAPQTTPGVRRIGDSILVIDAEGTYCVVIEGSERLAVIDTGPGPAAAAKVRNLAAEVFGRTDVAFVVSTHCHWDHVDGNQVFAGAQIVAHRRCPAAMERSFADRTRLMTEPTPVESAPPPPPPGITLPPPEGSDRAQVVGPGGEMEGMSQVLRDRFSVVDLTLPRITFTDRMTLSLGNLTLHLIEYGGGHSTSDILIVIPEEGLFVSGDVFFHQQLPLVTGDGIPEPERWLEALDILDGLGEIRTAIPGHGELVSQEELSHFKRYIRWVVSETRSAPRSAEPADALLHGALNLEHLPTLTLELDPDIAATVHQANVIALVESSGR